MRRGLAHWRQRGRCNLRVAPPQLPPTPDTRTRIVCDKRLVGVLSGISLRMERPIDTWSPGWDIRHHQFVWEFRVLHRWTGVVRALQERERDGGEMMTDVPTALFGQCRRVFGARIEAKNGGGAVPEGVHELGRGRCAIALART